MNACRARIRALVKDAAKAKAEFGPYIEPISGSVNDANAVREAMRGARAVVVTGAAGAAINEARRRRVQHLILPHCDGAALRRCLSWPV